MIGYLRMNPAVPLGPEGRVMVASRPGISREEIAQEVFEVLTYLGLATLPRNRREADLKEVEFLTLAILHDRGTLIVGDIQRQLGVLPAQMSRILRSLEDRSPP